MHKLKLTILFAVLQTLLYAQTGTMNGKILDTGNKPVEGAIISLLRTQDSSFVKTAISENNGAFELLQIKPGDFFLAITCTGFAPYSSTSIQLTLENLQIPPIQLSESNQQLKEVTVVARKPFVEKKIDRTIINPDALISNAGANSLEVLEKAPGIQVNPDGIISLKGKQGVAVFIDDKPTYLSDADLANYLRSLPAGTIQTIEIMTNPPAKYDAAGNAGVINIKIKKTKAEGFNGGVSIGYGQGFYARSNNNVNFNYRVNKVNLFTNAGWIMNNSYQDLTIWRRYFDGQGVLNSAFTQQSYIKKQNQAANLRLGMDYYISDKTVVGLVFSGARNPSRKEITNNARITDANGVLQALNEAQCPSDLLWKNGNANLNFSHQFDSKGKSLSANFDYLNYRSTLTQSLTSEVFNPVKESLGRSILDSSLPSDIDIQSAKVDYTHPLKKGGTMELGAKSSWVNTSNIADFFDVVDNENIPNYAFSNNFKYRENINAAYLNANKSIKKWTFQAGLRFENTSIEGNQLGNVQVKDSIFTRDYNSLFPTFYAEHPLDTGGLHVLGFSYGRRIDRPDYMSMNPFTYPMDRFTLYGGNPFLRPTFSNNFELSHTYKNMVTTTLQLSVAKDIINETIEQRNNIFYSRPGNIGEQLSYGISVNGAIPIKKWWTFQMYSELMHNDFESVLYGQTLKNKGTYWYVQPTCMFQINAKWNAELGGVYQTRIYSGQFVLIPVGNVRAAVACKILKDKGTIKLNVSDLFYTNQPGGDIKGLGDSAANWYSLLDTRVATVTFSYRFSKGQTLRARQSGGAESEQKRVRT
jgi:iron complex outermembrane recepter protein